LAKKSFAWFENRHKTDALNLAQKQIEKALDTVEMLEEAVRSILEGKKKQAIVIVEQLFKEEEDVDSLRRSVFAEMVNAAMSAELREDLMHLVKRLDVMADHVKDAARCVIILVERDVPMEIWKMYSGIAGDLVCGAKMLRDSIKYLGVDADKVKETVVKIDEVEHQIDIDYLSIRKSFVKYVKEVDSSTLLVLNDLATFMENASDVCADTADYVAMLSSEK
jgi:predicted phosphate transport protein (TIGR00153 family)